MSRQAGAYGGASAAAIQHHYDLSDDFFALWLDPSRTYSCALWLEGPDTLEDAQRRKLDHLAGLAGAQGRARVLEVGCGWGGMLRRLVERWGVSRAVGLTLSRTQARHVAAAGDERCDVRLENWRDHEPERGYDAIVSIGALEHFARFGMGRAARVASYREFFERCAQWLPPGGRLALQTNVKGSNVRLDRETVREMLFIVERIFPESEIPWFSEVVEASERLFDLRSLRNDPDHYARTCRAWHDGLVAARDRAVELVGADVVADYERYLGAAARHFEQRHLGLVRAAFERV